MILATLTTNRILLSVSETFGVVVQSDTSTPTGQSPLFLSPGIYSADDADLSPLSATFSEMLKSLVIKMIKSDKPVWFGCDVGKMSNGTYGIMDTKLMGRTFSPSVISYHQT